jgi:hypothetical protein
MFEVKDEIINNCTQCQWYQTSMCPADLTFVGRPMSNRELKICHRFYLTPEVRQRRWAKLMKTLEQGIND